MPHFIVVISIVVCCLFVFTVQPEEEGEAPFGGTHPK